ncbi:hypothetical protein MROS_1209 [Melioribacter roseus P3M-2]|uniref:Uncharacterized protein n=1 Tax=Melioribacter roseus (strain DSM 23840 / JCM 17771 / VKM B-2668 / P3M-2) TaxID=1191523 RepID=I7A3J0_MELRP|nr:hypothetical protein [Melioribacter roseus]AFN74446.1 hypothetical protein MROS_1209 [Melioribacter roseus P3M-2]
MKNLIKSFLIVVILLVNSCGEGITEPEPGRRDYVWERDTLRSDEFGFQFLSSIWASSPNDVWVVGDAAAQANKVWRYDGIKWRNYHFEKFITPISIHGISGSEVWMVTTLSEIWKWNGFEWKKDTTIIPEGYQRILFEDIYGYKNDIYAVGIAEKTNGDYTGVIVHYDGKKWKILSTPKIKEYFVRVLFLEKEDILITAYTFNDPLEPARLYKYENEELILLDKSWIDYILGILNGKLYVNTDRKVYEYTGGELILKIDLSNTNYAGGLIGRSINDFFAGNYGWNLGHYNGKSIIDLYYMNGNLVDGIVFDKDVFFICHDNSGPYYILHGKLK